jgi:Methyltransferase domain
MTKNRTIKKILNSSIVRRSSDILISPVTFLAAIWYRYIRSAKASSMPLSERIFMTVGVLPVNDHYYQPLINPAKYLNKPLEQDRILPGIDFNADDQVELFKQFTYESELNQLPIDDPDGERPRFFHNNPSFSWGDAETFYNILRHFKPKRIIEIGCGYSTLLAQEAASANKADNREYHCRHICIEPYEMPWLEKLDVEVIRKKLEEIDLSFFSQLQGNDILFIDSSHIIRPQGDVLCEYLEILPKLNSGVLVHVHDIFSPKDYPREWVIDEHCLWNEQYLLEAFLTFNKEFKIITATNFLKHQHAAIFQQKCPGAARVTKHEPGSFWMVKK